jgi:hypothetical protein
VPIPAGPDVDPADLPPEHSLQVGDVRQPTLEVVAYDGTPGSTTADPPTAVTCTVTAPGVAAATLATTTPDGGANWVAAAYTCGLPTGRWIETWTVTGHGADKYYSVVLVHPAPTAGGQTWIPTREQVAAIIPRRTHVGATTGWGVTQNTFSDLTRPSATVVDDLISKAARWIEVVAGPIVNDTIEENATDAAAMYVAGLILTTWPDSDQDFKAGQLLLDRADRMRKDLAAANILDTGTDPVAPVAVMPVWYFPPATELTF